MISLKQHPYALILFVMLFIFACKKSNTLKKEASKEEEKEEEPAVKLLIPIKLESAGLTINLKYKDNTALLTEISSTDGNKTIISYTNDLQLSKLEKYKNEKLYYSVYYEKDSKQIINKAILFSYNDPSHNYTPQGFYTLMYNDQHQLTEIKYYNNNSTNNLIKTETRSYAPSGNLLTGNVLNYPAQANVMGYDFDDKKGISSYIVQSPLLAIDAEQWFLMSSVNNILGYTNQTVITENVSFSYEYNEDGYPSKMITTKNKITQNMTITYKAIP